MNNAASSQLPPSARFRGQVLNRIYRVWLFRKLAPILIAEILIITVLLYQLGRIVFVRQVAENGINVLFTNPTGIFSFVTYAFVNAGMVTKIVALALTLAVAFLIRHFTQGALRLILVRQNYFASLKQP